MDLTYPTPPRGSSPVKVVKKKNFWGQYTTEKGRGWGEELYLMEVGTKKRRRIIGAVGSLEGICQAYCIFLCVQPTHKYLYVCLYIYMYVYIYVYMYNICASLHRI